MTNLYKYDIFVSIYSSVNVEDILILKKLYRYFY